MLDVTGRINVGGNTQSLVLLSRAVWCDVQRYTQCKQALWMLYHNLINSQVQYGIIANIGSFDPR